MNSKQMSESVGIISEFGELPDQKQEADDTPLYMDHTETGLIPRRHFRHLVIQGDDTTDNPELSPNHNCSARQTHIRESNNTEESGQVRPRHKMLC